MQCIKLSFMIKNFEKWREVMGLNIINLVLKRYWKSMKNEFKCVGTLSKKKYIQSAPIKSVMSTSKATATMLKSELTTTWGCLLSLSVFQPFNVSLVSIVYRRKDWRCVVLCEIDFLLKICERFLACFSCGVKLLEYRYVQIWITAIRWKQSPVGWFLQTLQKT